MAAARPARPVVRVAALFAALFFVLPSSLVPATVASTVDRPFTPRFDTTDRGAISLVGNTLLTCPASATCTNARNGTGGSINNNDFSMVYVDVDGDGSTFDSSTADLALPAGATVLFAGLYWGAASVNANRDRVSFALPGGGYQAIIASQVTTSGTSYTGFADVTSLVAGLGDPNGTYGVGNVQANIGGNTAAGWSLVVAYRDLGAPLRNLTVFDGLASINTNAPSSLTTAVSGFLTPATGPVNVQVGAVTLEGDLGLTGDQFRINGVNISNGANPSTNVFNSSVSSLGTTITAKSPNYLNQLGFDIDLLDGTGTIGNSATSANLTFTTSGDVYYPFVLTFAVDVFQPQLVVPKAQSDVNGAPLRAGDQIEYTVGVTNTGNDPATDVILRDPIPTGTTYVPGTLAIVSGAGAGALTDASGDDRGEYDSLNHRVVVRLGAGGTAAAGGTLAPTAMTSIRFRVAVVGGAAPGLRIENQALVSYRGATLGGSFVADSDGDDGAAGDQPTVLTVDALPTAANDAAVTGEDTPVVIDVLANDTDPDGNLDPTSVTVTGGPSHGTVSVNPVTGAITYSPAANYNGPDSFTYQVCDTSGNCDTATVSVTVVPVPDPPTAAADTATTNEDTPVVINLLANDSDPDGNLDPTSVTVLSGPAHGTVSINPVTGAATYTPATNYNGPDSFTYQVCDLLGECSTASVSVTVNPANDPPVARDDTTTTPNNAAVVIDVVANDSDVDGNLDPTTVTITSAPSSGTTSVNPVTGAITYTPVGLPTVPDTLTYRVCDTLGACDTATVTITFVAVNVPPVAGNDSATTNEDTPVTVNVVANDSDANGNLAPSTVTVTSGPAHGTVSVNPVTGAITYTPSANYNGPDTLTYQICDTLGACDTATVALTVNPVNDRPVANDDSAATPEDVPVAINLLANDTDVDGNLDPTTVTITTPPAHGSVSVNPVTGVVTYTPAANYSGPDTFSYRVCDTGSPVLCATASASVDVAVIAIDDRPVAVDDSATTNEDTPVTVNILGNDSDPDGNLDPTSVTILAGPSHGTVSVNPVTGALTYTPAANYSGSDSITYQVCDTNNLCAEASVTLTVRPVADPPVAVADTGSTVSGSPVTVDVLANDSDPDGDLDPTSVTITSGPAHGSVSVDPVTGAITYTSGSSYVGPDSVTYQVCDLATPPNCSTAVLTLDVATSNVAPVAVDDPATTNEDTPVTIDVLANDSDADGNLDPTSVTVTAGPAHGTVSINPVTGAITYTPAANYNGPDSFTYQVCDTLAACDTATVSLTVNAANDPPVAVADPATTNEDTPVTIDVLANDSDVDGNLDPTSVTVTAGPAHGTVSINPVTGAITYTPAANYNGPDTFTYQVCDTADACDTAIVSITVDAANDPPLATNDTATTVMDKPVVINVLGNDTDVDGNLDPASVSVTTGPSHGTVSVNPVTGAVTYTPATGYVGSDTFTYQVCDAADSCVSADVRIVIGLPPTDVFSRPESIGIVMLLGGLVLAFGLAVAAGKRRRRLT